MNRNTSLTLVLAAVLCCLVLFSLPSATLENPTPESSYSAAKIIGSERLCGRGKYDVCDWRVRERRSNF